MFSYISYKERLKITLQNIFFHRSWPVEWSSPPPHPECWIPVNLQATTENSSLSTLLDYLKKKKKKKYVSFHFFKIFIFLFLFLSFPVHLNNAWDLVLLALPLYVCLFKINRFMYSQL